MTSSLLAELRRSTDAETRRVGELLGALVPGDGAQAHQPRATDALAAFLAAQDSPYESSDAAPAAGPADLLVLLGPAPVTQRAPRRRLASLPAFLHRSLLAKVALAAAVAL
ncbi:MAG: hypothetical protein LH461_04695, partial [Spirochaetaceae bacterium]|nr:hypothetical protein [Spirochaetaceae bacterium]